MHEVKSPEELIPDEVIPEEVMPDEVGQPVHMQRAGSKPVHIALVQSREVKLQIPEEDEEEVIPEELGQPRH